MNRPNRSTLLYNLPAFTLMSLVLSTAGCCTTSQKAAQKRVGKVTHVVICWLKEPGNAEARAALIRTSNTFTQIPGVLSVRAGVPLPSTRPVVDTSYDVAVVITFDSIESLRAYDSNPIHLEAVKSVLRPLAAKMVIYDFDHAP